jgi:hypothetical protein
MSFVGLANFGGLVLTPGMQNPQYNNNASSIINAAGESTSFIGQVQLSTGPGTSKTISTGKIFFQTSTSCVFATAGSTVRVGIQDVNAATGIEDGTYDVFDDLVQGTEAIPSSSVITVTMSSGTKTITHGDMIAVVIEFTVRNGADQVSISRILMDSNLPYCTVDTGAIAKFANGPLCAILFDDGTLGHFGEWTIPFLPTEQALASNTTPDEYALAFQVPFSCKINALFLRIGDIDAGETATCHLIQDPYGAITNLVTVTLDPALQGQLGVIDSYTIVPITETTLAINTVYAISYRPTSTGSRILRTVTIADAALLKAFPLAITGATRTDLGAFSSSSVVFADFGFRVSKLDDGTGTTGGATSSAYIG